MKRSMVSVMILAAVLAFLYVPIILVVVYGFVPNGISMSFFGSDGSFLGFTGKWYRYIFTGHQSVRALLQSFWLSLVIAGLSTVASCAIGTTSALALHKWRGRLQSIASFSICIVPPYNFVQKSPNLNHFIHNHAREYLSTINAYTKYLRS